MKKRILIVYYSQTGQLLRILQKIAEPTLNNKNIDVEYFKIEMENDFPFPWNRKEFFGIMPDSVQEKAHPIKVNTPVHDNYDLVILGYQVWFLSPSVPFNSFLESEVAKRILKSAKVVTVIGGRNMWVMAQESIRKKLKSLDSVLVGNIALVDNSPNLVSVVTIIYWLFHGKTDRLLNLFPKPGIKSADIEKGTSFGQEIVGALTDNNFNKLQENLVEKGAVNLKPDIISMETKAKKVFGVWAKIVNGSGKNGSFGRKAVLFLFEIYLYFVILFLSPLVSILSTFAAILRRKATAKKMAYFSGV